MRPVRVPGVIFAFPTDGKPMQDSEVQHEIRSLIEQRDFTRLKALPAEAGA